MDHLASSNLDKRKSNKNLQNDIDTDDVINKFAKADEDHALTEPWIANNDAAQAARLQANGFEIDIEQKQRRNDVLFLGKFLLI